MTALGFTGTRRGLTRAQRAAMARAIHIAIPERAVAIPESVIHGGAEGADSEFDLHMAPLLDRFFTNTSDSGCIEVWPASEGRRLYWLQYAPFGHLRTVLMPRLPLARNRVIVARCDRLLACPGEMEEVIRSGTWATVRYARAAGKPVTILFPDGSVKKPIDISDKMDYQGDLIRKGAS